MAQESRTGEIVESTGRQASHGAAAPSPNFRRYALWGAILLFVVFGVFGAWAATAPLSGAVIAPGQIVVASNSKTIQHLHGGIVRRIAVDEGTRVDVGDLLVRLDPTAARAELERVGTRFVTSLAEATRLRAELDDQSGLTFAERIPHAIDAPIDLDVASIKATQRRIFTARRDALDSELAALTERIDRLRGRIDGIQQVIASLNEQIDSYAQEIAEWSDLYKDKLANKQELRKARRSKMELEAKRAAKKAEIARLRSEIQSTRMQRTLRRREFNRKAAERLGEVSARMREARARIPKLKQRLERTAIKAPVAGEVVDLRVHTLGGVVDRGQPLMKIVPLQDRLVIRARIDPADIDNVRAGQDATLRFPALNTALVKTIHGTVTSVSADTLQAQDKKSRYYLARVEVTEKGTRELRRSGLSLQAGMPVTAMVQTDPRTLVSYLLEPIIEMMSMSMREP